MGSCPDTDIDPENRWRLSQANFSSSVRLITHSHQLNILSQTGFNVIETQRNESSMEYIDSFTPVIANLYFQCHGATFKVDKHRFRQLL